MLYIIGASGHGRVVLDVLNAMREFFSGEPLHPMTMPIPELYTDKICFADQNSELAGRYLDGHKILCMKTYALHDVSFFFVAIGDNGVRQKIYDELKSRGYPTGVLTSPFAYVSPEATIGNGTLINHGAIIQPGILIGENCIINTGAKIDHDCKIGNHAHISPGATLCGSVHIGNNTMVGAGTIIKPGASIGSNCFISMGSKIKCDIPDGYIVNTKGVIKERSKL